MQHALLLFKEIRKQVCQENSSWCGLHRWKHTESVHAPASMTTSLTGQPEQYMTSEQKADITIKHRIEELRQVQKGGWDGLCAST